ncbi:MAG: diacylglycerol kinase family protein [Cytophagaceae bacterium]|nr:diacylglycerol kinase family protein [Cytophagaceae bacterium]
MIDVPKFRKSLSYAFKGLKILVVSENNARIHLVATAGVAVAGYFFDVTKNEWLWLALAVALVWLAEAMNTAIEKLVDLVSPEYHPLAGQVKDLTAAAVLITALFALLVAGIVFGGAVIQRLDFG